MEIFGIYSWNVVKLEVLYEVAVLARLRDPVGTCIGTYVGSNLERGAIVVHVASQHSRYCKAHRIRQGCDDRHICSLDCFNEVSLQWGQVHNPEGGSTASIESP
jgi:hypothetical protein